MRLLLVFSLLLTSLCLAGAPSQPEAEVYIISPSDGDQVTSPVRVLFGLRGMGVAPAQTPKRHTGHHHLLLNVPSLPPMDQPIPSDEHHFHFGAGQTETELVLEPGVHTLRLLLGDHQHRPHTPPLYSEQITIEVK